MSGSFDLFGDATEVDDKFFYVDDLANQAKPIDWIVEGILPAGCQIIIAGSPKVAKKTLLMMHLADCVSRGQPFLGFKVHRRPVLYIACEDGEPRMARRWKALGRGGSIEDLDRLALTIRFGLTGYERAKDVIRETQCLVICDPMVEVMSAKSVDENDSGDVATFMREHREIVQKSNGAWAWTHHYRKAGDVMRGSVAMQGSVDGWIDVSPRLEALRFAWTCRDGEGGAIGVRISSDASGHISFEPTDAPEEKEYGNGKSNGYGNGHGNDHGNGNGYGEHIVTTVRQLFYERRLQSESREVLHAALNTGKTGRSRTSKSKFETAMQLLAERGEIEQSVTGGWQATPKLVDLLERQAKQMTVQ